jgi:hypothetical protein
MTSQEDKETLEQLFLAERVNGIFAMVGFVAAVGAYAVTGQIIPGVF